MDMAKNEKVVVIPDEKVETKKNEAVIEVKKTSEQNNFSVVSIATQTADVIVNSKNEELSEKELLVQIANDLQELKKGLL
jgi:hypothetical protein